MEDIAVGGKNPKYVKSFSSTKHFYVRIQANVFIYLLDTKNIFEKDTEDDSDHNKGRVEDPESTAGKEIY